MDWLHSPLICLILFTKGHTLVLLPVISEMMNITIKIKNIILAIPAAADTIPKNPKTPATSAIIRNKIAAPII
jgi:hypothetical protein